MIRINRESFLKTLESVQPGLSAREILEQSTCFIFMDEQVQALNDEVVVRAPLALDGLKGAVRAVKLLEILKKLPEEELDVGVEDGQLVLVGKRRKTGIRMETEIHHPLVGALDEPEHWTPLHKDFAEAVGVVGLCAATTNQDKFARVCLHVTPEWMEAHDGIQACRWYLKTDFAGEQRPSGEWAGTLLRQASIKHIVSLNMTEFAESPHWVHFRNPEGVVLSCRRYVEDYPEDSQGEFKKTDGETLVLPKGLVEAADHAAVFSRDSPDANMIKVELKPGVVRLLGESISGYHRESKKLAYEGAPATFMIAPDLLADIVKRHNEVKITSNRLRVVGGAYHYMACLFSPQAQPVAEPEEQEAA